MKRLFDYVFRPQYYAGTRAEEIFMQQAHEARWSMERISQEKETRSGPRLLDRLKNMDLCVYVQRVPPGMFIKGKTGSATGTGRESGRNDPVAWAEEGPGPARDAVKAFTHTLNGRISVERYVPFRRFPGGGGSESQGVVRL